MTYETIVVGTDGSATAQEAVGQAAALAAADGARLVVVTAYRPGESPARGVDPDRLPEDLRFVLTDQVQAEELAERGRALAREQGAQRTVVRALPGEPAEVLLEAADELQADLIVVGSRGLGSHAHVILGSVAASVAHHAPCDVLVAHTAD